MSNHITGEQSTPSSPPPGFLAKMRRLLGDDEYHLFALSLDGAAPTGVRINTLKTSVDDFINNSPFALSPVGSFEPAGFVVTDDSRPGLHPYHHAGLFYIQEPSAMGVAPLMQPRPGECILDLAAAPGGKATHLAALMQDTGILVANDINRGRARHLVTNLERWGARNVVITNEAPHRLLASFGPIFDRVLVDAPCSGEGMFRRHGSAEWSQEIVNACGRRQTHILETAAGLVRPGGLLTYATCTFSAEENEEVIGRFLSEQNEFTLLHPPQFSGFDRGRPNWVAAGGASWLNRQELAHTVRIWPHRFAGEGHFIALLQRVDGDPAAELPVNSTGSPTGGENLELWHQFARSYLRADFPDEQLLLLNGRLYLRPKRDLDCSPLRMLRQGLLLGELRRGYFKPAHALALALRTDKVAEFVNWTADSNEIASYLGGQSIREEGPDGWVLVAVDSHGLGWTKRVSGVLKNHYPRGLRQMART